MEEGEKLALVAKYERLGEMDSCAGVVRSRSPMFETEEEDFDFDDYLI